MRAADPQLAAFQILADAGGALMLRSFEDAQADDAIGAIAATLQADPWIAARPLDAGRLEHLGWRAIDERTFFGDAMNDAGLLVKRGSGQTSRGPMSDPPLVSLEGVTLGRGARNRVRRRLEAASPTRFVNRPTGWALAITRPRRCSIRFAPLSCRPVRRMRSVTGPARICRRYRPGSPPAWSGGACSCSRSTSRRCAA